MAQDTTKEFAARFERAVEGHPLAPTSQYGRQAWVLEKLKTETGLEVSANTMSKWFTGSARPREDNIRKIAQVLQVDEVWLSLGRKPIEHSNTPTGAERSRGAVLMVAGMIEMEGGRVTFPGPDAAPIDLQVNMTGQQFNLIVVTPTENGDKISCIVNEPVGDARIVAPMATSSKSRKGSTVCFDLFDLTDVDRHAFGGFSVIEMRRADAHTVRIENGDIVKALGGVSEMA